MNYKNFTQDQKDSVWIILALLSFATVTFIGAGLLVSISPIISVLLIIGGLFLIVLSGVGYYVEFVEKA